jgi:sugar phosphate isomerase/epimerase/signal transduction histidine kinase
MRIGCQTILFGRSFHSKAHLRDCLRSLASVGFDGVEISQLLDSDSFSISVGELTKMLDEYRLELVSLTGGTLSQRIGYLEGRKCEYLYTDRYNENEMHVAFQAGYVLGVHPHVFGDIETVGDWDKLKARPDLQGSLKFLPDTAHLTIAGSDVVEAISARIGETIAVHVKDWKPEYGSSSHRYARGFCNLGQGSVLLREVMAYLIAHRFNGWVIWELDHCSSPLEAIQHAADWLRSVGVTMNRRYYHGPVDQNEAREKRLVPPHGFLEALCDAAQKRESVYRELALVTASILGVPQVDLWASTPAKKRLSLLGSTWEVNERLWTVPWHDALCIEAIHSQRSRDYRITPEIVGDAEMCQTRRLEWMVSVPVFDSFNPHSVQYVLNAFCRKEERLYVRELADALVNAIALALARVVDSECTSSSLDADECAVGCDNAHEYLYRIAELIRATLRCSAVAILFRENSNDAILWSDTNQTHSSRRKSIGAPLNESDREHPAINSWLLMERRQFEIEEPTRRRNDIDRSSMTLIGDVLEASRRAGLIVPILTGRGRTAGVAFCSKSWNPESGCTDFCDDDSATVASILDTASENIHNLLAKERRDVSRSLLKHSLGQPLFEIRGFWHTLQNDRELREQLRADYAGDVRSWIELITRLLRNPPYADNLFRISSRETPTFLINGVIAAVVRQLEGLLRERGFSKWAIQYHDLRRIPKLLIDRNRFQQIYLNLLSNAVKYAHKDKTAFAVKLGGELDTRELRLYIQDFGIGVPEVAKSKIFEEGFRLEHPEIEGEGLGLAYVKRIIEMYDGRVAVTNCRYPTEITMTFPRRIVVTPIEGV